METIFMNTEKVKPMNHVKDILNMSQRLDLRY